MFYTFQIGSFPSPRFNFLSISWLVQATHGTFTEDWILELVLLYYPPTHGTPLLKSKQKIEYAIRPFVLVLVLVLVLLFLNVLVLLYLHFSPTPLQLELEHSGRATVCRPAWSRRRSATSSDAWQLCISSFYLIFFLCFDWSLFWLVSVRGPYDNPPPPLMPCYCFFTLQMCVF